MSASAAVPIRRVSYPQVDPRAAGLMHRSLVIPPSSVTIGEAAGLAERGPARLVAARMGRGWGGASRDTLGRAIALGLAEAPLATILWDAALVPPSVPEIILRRQLGPDRPFVLVRGTSGPVGVVFRDPAAPGTLPLDLGRQLQQLPEPLGELLRLTGSAGDALGLPVAVVGGLVRDLLLGRVHERTDVDLVAEGSAAAVAHRLAAGLSGRVTEHATFLTASVMLSDGRRVDVATARRESYRAPGALPAVEPATL